MAINDSNAEQYQKAIASLEMRLRSDSENPEVTAESLQRTQSNLDRLRAEVSAHEQSSRPVDNAGKLTKEVAPAPGSTNEVEGSGYNFWYEPNVDTVKQHLSNPENAARLNLTSWTQSPDQLDAIRPGTSAYDTAAEDLWQQDAAKAQAEGRNLKRYSKLNLKEHPLDVAAGGFTRGMNSLGRGLNTAFLGIPGRAADEMADAMGTQRMDLNAGNGVNPTAAKLAEIVGVANPFSPANIGTRGLAELAGYETAGTLGKAAISGLSGAAVNNAAPIIEDAVSHPDKSVDDVLGDAYNNAPMRSAMGFGLGAGGDLAGQLAGGITKSVRSNSPDIKLAEEAGATVGGLKGVNAPPKMQADIDAYTSGRAGEVPRPEDIAANRVVPQLRQAQIDQAREAHNLIGSNKEAYFNHPLGLQEHSTRPAVENMLEMMEQGSFKSPVKGTVRAPDPGKVALLRKELANVVDVKAVPLGKEGQVLADTHDGVLMDAERAANILGKALPKGKQYVIIPAKMNARAIDRMEEKIYEKLGFAKSASGRDDPMWRGLNEGFKKVRDQFDYPEAGLPAPETPKGLPPEMFTERRSPNRPTNEEYQVMQRPEGVDHNTPISNAPEAPSEIQGSSVGAGDTGPPVSRAQPAEQSIPAPMSEVRGNKRYQEPSASEYAEMQAGNNVDKSGNGYQRIMDVQDIAPGYKLKTNPTEANNLASLADEYTALEAIHKANPGITEEEANAVLNAQRRMSTDETPYTPEFPKEESLKDWHGAPFPRDKSPFDPKRIGKDYGSEWAPNEDLYTENPAESIPAEEYKSAIAPEPTKTAPASVPKAQKSESLFPGVEDQVGNPNKTEMAQAAQTPDVGKVKDIVSRTDKAADNLTPGELDAIHSYTSRKAEKVGTKEWDSAVKKLTVQKPTEGGTLHSGTRLPQEQIDKILKSKRFSMDKPTSTSYNKGIASSMAYSRAGRGEPVIFEIPEVDNGVSLASKKLGIAGTNNEKEILLNNKDFEVSGSRKNEDGDLVITLKQRPTQMRAKLDNGETVRGWSALQRKHHETQTALEEASSATGSNSTENATRRVQGFGGAPGQAERDATLLAEAKKLGLESELRAAAGTAAYQRLAARAFGQSGGGLINRVGVAAGMRLDPILQSMAGNARNPAAPGPNTPAGRIAQYLFNDQARNLADLTQGQPAVKFAPLLEDIYNEQNRKR